MLLIFQFKTCFNLLNLDESIRNTVDVENVAEGLAWQYYYGFLKLVLPGIYLFFYARLLNNAFNNDYSTLNKDSQKTLNSEV